MSRYPKAPPSRQRTGFPVPYLGKGTGHHYWPGAALSELKPVSWAELPPAAEG